MAPPEQIEVNCAPDQGLPPVPRWERYARYVGLLLLVVVSIYGIREFVTGDATAVTAFWSRKLLILPAVFALAALDIALETVAWVWIVERCRMRARDLTGVAVSLSGKAGALLPAQLGRLIRPDAMVRLGRGTVEQCFKAEGAVFVLDSLSVVALLTALAAWRIHPALAPLTFVTLVIACLYLGGRIGNLLSGTRLEMPPGFWWSWKSFAIVTVESVGWIAHGLAFYVLAYGLPGNFGLWDALFLAPGSAVLGVGSGMPGGLGATEGLLGASLRINDVPAAHFAMGVAAFRVVTFWLWIPVGWAALTLTRRHARANGAQARQSAPVPQEQASPGEAEPVAHQGISASTDGG